MRTKKYTVVGIAVNTVGIAASQAPSVGALATNIALSQAYDTAAVTTNIASAQTYTTGVGLTLQALAAALLPPRKVTLTSATNQSATSFTIVGFNELGNADSEVLVGPNANTVTSVKVYSSVTSVTPNATDAVNTVSAGSAANSVPYQLTLNGALGHGLNVVSDVFASQKVTLTTSDDLSARTFTVVGLASNGLALTEVITGPNNTTATSINEFTRVDHVTPDDDASGSLSVGTAGVSSGTSLTLTAGAAALSPVRFVTLSSTSDLRTINFTITGTDRWGNAQQEVLVGPNNNTVQSKGVYASVTSIVPSAASGSNVSAGWPVGGVTPWVLGGLGMGVDNVPICQVSLLASVGSVTGTLDVTYDEFPRLAEPSISIDQAAVAITAGTPKQIQGEGVRFVLTSGAGTTAEVRFLRAGVLI